MKTLLTLHKFSTTAATRRGRYYGPTSTSSRKALDRTLSISSYRAWNHCACRLRRWICVLGQYKEHVAWRNAFSVLSFGAVSVTMSARFARKGAFNCRTFHGNPIALWSYLIMTVLQVFITYCPGLNTTIFSNGSNGWLVLGHRCLVHVLCAGCHGDGKGRSQLFDQNQVHVYDDKEDWIFDSPPERDDTPLPPEVDRFGKNEATR